MVKTIDKVLLGILAILVIGMSAVFITALNTNQEQTHANQLVMKEQMRMPIIEQDEADEEVDVPITGSALEKASAVALAYIGEGRVTDTEVGDEESYYEIEVTLNDGSQADVQLDENFNVISTKYEDGEEDDD